MTNHDGSFDENDGLEARLARLGAQPVDPATQSAHLTAMASARVPRRRLREKAKVAAALAGGFMLGSTGLAFAGALPAPVQDAASEAIARVGVSAPVGTERYFGDGCVAGDDGFPRNRGLYLKQERAKGAEAFAAAKDSDCGRPLVSLGGDKSGDVEEAGSEANEAKPERCVSGEMVTGRSNGKGRSAGKGKSEAATSSTKPCESAEPGQAPAGGPEAESTDDAPKGAAGEARPSEEAPAGGGADDAPVRKGAVTEEPTTTTTEHSTTTTEDSTTTTTTQSSTTTTEDSTTTTTDDDDS